MLSGRPSGATAPSGIAAARASMRSSCCSTSRMLVRYSSRMALSAGAERAAHAARLPRPPSRAGSASAACCASRLRVEPVSPNMRSNVTRGLTATGSGLVSSRHEMALKNTHGIAVARAGGRAHVLGAHLERPQRRVLGNRVGDVLVDRLLRLDDELRLLGDRAGAVEPRGAGAHVHAAHVGVAVGRLHPADGHQVAAVRPRAAA